jgi:hypothetical protein
MRINEPYSQYPKWIREELIGRADLEVENSKPKPKRKKKSLCRKLRLTLALLIRKEPK